MSKILSIDNVKKYYKTTAYNNHEFLHNIIIGNMIAMFTIRGKEAMGMKMYSPDLAQALRSLFELAWENAKEYDRRLSKKKK